MKSVLSELVKGKSMSRILQNQALGDFTLEGRVLDVAGKREPSYKRYLKNADNCEWTVADYDDSFKPDLCFDASGKWPIGDGEFDSVLLMNCLYIFKNPSGVIGEAARVLRKGGHLVLTTPFLWNEVPEPTDYFRFTSQGTMHIAREAGLEPIKLVPVGGRFVSCVEMTSAYLRKARMYVPLAMAALGVDRFLEKRSSLEKKHPAPWGYVMLARK